MTGAVKAVKDAFEGCDCFVTTCRKGKCKISLQGAPASHVIVDFDKPGLNLDPNVSRCDYLFVADGNRGNPDFVAPMELSTGVKRPSKLVNQLQAGADIAAKSIDSGIAVTFRPVFAGPVMSGFRNEFRKSSNRIKFRGKMEQIRSIRSGGRLMEALRQRV